MGASGLRQSAAAIDDNNQRCARAQVYAAPMRAPTGTPWLRVRIAWAMHQQRHWALLGFA
eukprot:14587827-Alexandrium_andersonii.AAC.1